MKKAQQKRFDSFYKQHLNALKRQGKSKATIDAYSRPLRRIAAFFDRLSLDNIKDYFSSLIENHSWSTVKLDRNGLQFFYKHVLNKKWQWVDIVKQYNETATIYIFLSGPSINHNLGDYLGVVKRVVQNSI